MKTLYITDLDGTFLKPDASIGSYSKNALDFLLQNGVLFSIATARTYATVIPMFRSIKLNTPLVLMNGVCIYDPTKRRTLRHHAIPIEAGKQIEEIFLRHQKNPMLYFENNDHLCVEYRWLENELQRKYVSSRDGFYNKGFCRVDAYSYNGKGDLIYAVTLDKKKEIEPIYREVSKLDAVDWNFYSDSYTDSFFLEGMAAGVSKASGAIEIKELTGADRIVAFGDNMNDLALFKIADEAYAVENACDELKRAATGVIGSNRDDAVAKYLMSRYESGRINE